MTPLAISGYDVAKAFHVIAAFAAYGLPLAYPMLIPYLRRRHPRALPGLHDVQHRLNIVLTGPGTVAVLALGLYMAADRHLFGRAWVDAGIAIVAVIAVAGGDIVRTTARLAEVSRADVAATPAGEPVRFSEAYQRLYRRYMAIEHTLGLLVLVAIFLMVTKP